MAGVSCPFAQMRGWCCLKLQWLLGQDLGGLGAPRAQAHIRAEMALEAKRRSRGSGVLETGRRFSMRRILAP